MNFAYKTYKHPNKANSQHLKLYSTNKEKEWETIVNYFLVCKCFLKKVLAILQNKIK